MHTDIVDLRDFYRTSLGQMARRAVRRRIRLIWPSVERMNVAGLGYTTPYLRPFLNEAERVMALMPSTQGVLPWPAEGPNMATLVEEAELPFQDASIDRILLVHALECSEAVRPMLSEVWRVLGAGGRLLVVAPNRRGVWARFDHTPFGAGHPYTLGQLSRLLRDAAFTPVASTGALFTPPVASRMVLSSARAWETAGERWFRSFPGVVLVEATKQIYAIPRVVAPDRRRRPAYNPAPTPI